MTRHIQEVFTNYLDVGPRAARTYEEARSLAKSIMGQAAYTDPKHPEHARAVQDVARLYEATTDPNADA